MSGKGSTPDLAVPADEPVAAVHERGLQGGLTACHTLGKDGGVSLAVGIASQIAETEALERCLQCRLHVEETVKDLGIKTYYAIYTNDEQTGETLWLKNGDGFRFKINELFDYDKNDIMGTFTRKKNAFCWINKCFFFI